jgi:dipeptidyl aminopeptidase/acylaminoacyl peptidase
MNLRIGVVCLFMLVGTAFLGARVRAEDRRVLSVEDALDTHSLGDLSRLALSPDGKWVAYVVRDNRRAVSLGSQDAKYFRVRTGIYEQNRFGDLWVADVITGETKNLTGGNGSSWGPAWSPDGRYLVFLSDRDGSEQARVWIWDMRMGNMRMLSTVNVRENLFETIGWSTDSQRVFVTAVPEGLSVDEYATRASSSEIDLSSKVPAPPGTTVRVFQSSPDSMGSHEVPLLNLNEYLADLIAIDVQTARTATIVQGRRIRTYSVSPTGSRVAYAVPKGFEKAGSIFIAYDLVVSDLSGGEGRVVASGIALDNFSWSPNGSLLAYGAYAANETSYDYYVAAPKTGAVRKVSSLQSQPPCCNFAAPAWSPSGESFYFLLAGYLWRTMVESGTSEKVGTVHDRQIQYLVRSSGNLLWTTDRGASAIVLVQDGEGKQDAFYKIDLRAGASNILIEGKQCYTSRSGLDSGTYLTSVSTDGRGMVFSAEDTEHPADIWIVDQNFLHVRQLTHLNPQIERHKLGAVRIVDWLSDDGEKLRGALLLPSSYEQGKRYPLIVFVYPGTALSDFAYRFGFGEYPGPLNMQLLATRGYAVLFPDSCATPGDVVRSLEKSVLPGISKVVEMGIAAPDAIGIIGHSFGGYGTMALITSTTRFKAAIAISGSADVAGDYGAMSPNGSSYGNRRGELLAGGTPVQYPLRYLESSPIYYFDRVVTPLFVAHGSRDEAAPVHLGDEIFVSLRRLGKTVEYARYEDEPHVPRDWSFPNQMDLARRMVDWFEKFLKPRQLSN